jgi:hypothetical protein
LEGRWAVEGAAEALRRPGSEDGKEEAEAPVLGTATSKPTLKYSFTILG